MHQDASGHHVITKLVDEPFFIQCADNLSAPDGTQAAIITAIGTIRLERRVRTKPETWEIAVDESGFSSLQILDDGTFTDAMVAGVMTADPDYEPPPDEPGKPGYRWVAECTIEFTSELGGGVTGKVFRRDVHIPASAMTAPAS